jgi:multidrug efflux pump subunit AcrB
VAQPFIIMTAVILSLGGAFLGLTVLNSPFGIIMTGVGVISLAGVVVNNGIVLIDYINKLRQRGFELREAVAAGGATRLRPVLLTAITTILGLLPMVTGVSYDFHRMAISWVSESSQWWRSMAIVVIFGLMVATFLTLVVVPVLYVFIEEGKMKLAVFRTKLRTYLPGRPSITDKEPGQ